MPPLLSSRKSRAKPQQYPGRGRYLLPLNDTPFEIYINYIETKDMLLAPELGQILFQDSSQIRSDLFALFSLSA